MRGYDIWHPIDAPLVVCKDGGAPGKVNIRINISDIALADRSKPHIVTFYRTTTQKTVVQYGARDSTKPQGLTVIGTRTVTLDSVVGTRRLAAETSPAVDVGMADGSSQLQQPAAAKLVGELLEPEEDEAEMLSEEDFMTDDGDMPPDEDADLDESEDSQDPDTADGTWRRLRKIGGGSFGGRSRGGGGFRPRPRPRPSPFRPRPRPSPPINTRRRGVQPPTGLRRRMNSPVDNKRYSNPSSARTGAYGYKSTTTIDKNYPSGYKSTGYGYSGGKAHSKGSTKKIVMAAGAGVVAGAAGYYLYSRWSSCGYGYGCGYGWYYGNPYCSYGSTWTGYCRDCYSIYSQCERSLPLDAARDDLMSSGFIPADYVFPIEIVISQIVGPEFAQSGICPPTGWSPNPNASNVSWTPPAQQDIYFTLTKMEELGDPSHAHADMAPGGLILLLLATAIFGRRFP